MSTTRRGQPSHGIRPSAVQRMTPRIVLPAQLRMRSRRKVKR